LRFIDLGRDQGIGESPKDRSQERNDDPVFAPLRNVQVLGDFMSVHVETPKQEYRRQKTVDRISTTNKKRIQKTEVRRQTPEYRSQETEDRIKNQKTRIQETEVRRPSKTRKKR